MLFVKLFFNISSQIFWYLAN